MTPQLRQSLSHAAEHAADMYTALMTARHIAERFNEHQARDELESLAAIAQDLHDAIGELLAPATSNTPESTEARNPG